MRLTGPLRLGIVLTALWLLISGSAYVASIYAYPSGLATRIPWAYNWAVGTEVVRNGIAFTPDNPQFSIRGLTAILAIPAIGWLLLVVMPMSAKWIRDGFRESK